MEKKQTLPLITETERFGSTTDGPSASVQKAQSSKRSISAANALHLFKKKLLTNVERYGILFLVLGAIVQLASTQHWQC